ncbi:LuxR C-terminal-related transcriptional regulator [Streptomyces sp. NRRL B-24085]|uniref:LuxR C-terminal-related transcriptional regulator n=1 Tax=Streptomyces sp. NRRL B-24085 TaxID=1709476 RepID=UPI0006B361ED|nr:LuxR C-terminal-related transcriptional regulator [Streptomyces sp. NRRL B-24085]
MVVSTVVTGDRNTAVPAAARVDPLGDPFLRMRFAVPSRPATFLSRPRLTKHLAEGLGTPLTMVNGSAGAGKTLLVADWTARLDRPVGWLTVETEEQRPGMFWAYFLHALGTAGTPLSDRIRCPADPGRVGHKVLSEIAEDLVGRDPAPVVVIDEFDRVSASEVAEQLEFVLQHAGSGLRLVLVTRNEPPFSLHRYRAAGTLTEIRDAELALNPGEAAALLELHGLSLPADSVRALVERTRGWAAGLRLCALAAQESPDPERYLKEFEADHSAVADFLLAEVLTRQPAATQDLLLRVSVLDRFCPDLVNGLTHRTDAGLILAELHRDNAFVEHLGQGWYRLHPLFGEILQTHLRVRHPGLEPDLHRAAARWMRSRGALPEALAHGAAAADWDFTAAAVVDDLAIGEFFTRLRSDDLNELFSRMAPGSTGPATELVQAARDLAQSDLDRGVAHLHHAEARLAAEDGDPAAAHLSWAFLEAVAARLTGSPARAEQAAETADEIRPEIPPHLLDKHPELSALLLTHLGSARLWAGHYEDARAALSEAVGCPGGILTVLPREESMGHLALLDYLDGWPGEAEHKALAAMTETERFSLPQPSGSGIERLVLAAVAVDRHELGRAQALLDEADRLDLDTQDPVTAAGRAIATARLHLARGNARAAVAAATPALSTAVASPWADSLQRLVTSTVHLAEGRPEAAAEVLRHLPDDQPTWTVEAARLHLASGRPDAAIDLLDSVPAESRPGPAVTVRAALVRAQAAQAAGDDEAARRFVAQALLLARNERLRRPFLDAGRWIRSFLAAAPLRSLAAEWLVPGTAPGPAAAGPRPGPLVVQELSEREHDVLQRLAQMMSTEEIAADLYLSANTVKTHLKSLYRKLAVNRRSEAVHRARDMGLL